MIGGLFLLIWTGLFVLIGIFSWMRIPKHYKVYLMMAYNCMYLTGVFLLYPKG